MTTLDFLVTRRGVDPAAETAAMALRDLLATPVAGVERGDLWRFEVDAASESLRAALARAACRAGRYVNTNRDRFEWLAGSRPYPAGAPPSGAAVDVWVTDEGGADAVALRYFRAQAGTQVIAVRRGTLWRLSLPAPADDARDRAWEIAATRGRRHGLLFNPHAQRAEILGVVVAATETRA